jgi:tRNA A37 N6-isopentenylltransferase MiaA
MTEIKPHDIIILGPSNIGKTDLGNFIATHLDIPLFNCDSVQVYKDLNLLTNKPNFVSQEFVNNEFISFIKPQNLLDFSIYKDLNFKVYKKVNSQLKSQSFEDYKEFFKFLIQEGLVPDKVQEILKPIRNYLFEIRKPLENYSIMDFVGDVDRISKKENFESKMIIGGTIYYAYHYLLGTNLESNNYELILEEKNESLEELIEYLQVNDPKALDLIDNKNFVRIKKAAELLRQTGKKFSNTYFKENKMLDNFLLIIMTPKNREEYCEKLDRVVENRMNVRTMEEVEMLIKRYGTEVEKWLENISYEYKYALQIYKLFKDKKDLSECRNIVEVLKAKERQYTKRQMTFLRKLDKKLEVFIN